MNLDRIAGQKCGGRWARDEATAEQLERLNDFSTVRQEVSAMVDAYSLAEHAVFAIEGREFDDYDREAAATFWEPYDNVNDDFVDGFIDGALEYEPAA